MNAVTEKIEKFLKENPSNHVCVSQGSRRLRKSTMPKYSFTLQDIENIYGSVFQFIKSIPENGFVSDVVVNLRSTTGFGASQRTIIKETITLNFKKEEPMSDNLSPVVNPMVPNINAPVQSHSPAMATPFLATPQVQFHDIISGSIAKERLDDKIKECQKLSEENSDLKSEIRTLKEQLVSLQIKYDTTNERHQLALEKERLNQKGFTDSQMGKMVSSIGGRLAAAYIGNQLGLNGDAISALAGAYTEEAHTEALAISQIKKDLIEYISSDAVSDEVASQIFNQIYKP